MNTHTHRGHCQVCLRIQAIEVQNGLIAKHGYNVKYGYYAGTCPGSHVSSLHMSRTFTDKMIETYLEHARGQTALAKSYREGTQTPVEVMDLRQRKMVFFKDISDKSGAIERESYRLERSARASLLLKEQLQVWAVRIHDNKIAAYRVEDLEVGKWKEGDLVRIGGKSGFNAVIEAIEDRQYRTMGFRSDSQVIWCPHGRVTRPARAERRSRTGIITHEAREALTYWEPLRHIKRPKSALIETLKKEGLL